MTADIPAVGQPFRRSIGLEDPTLRRIAIGVFGILMLLLLGFVGFLIGVAAHKEPIQPIRITACEPEVFDIADRCPAGSFVDPDGLSSQELDVVVSDQTKIPVAGRVINDHDEAIAYSISVSWVSLDATPLGQPGSTYVVLATAITWEPGPQEPYDIEWSIPAEILERSSDLLPGQFLGRWRIVGTATPVLSDKYSSYQWDSAKTFTMRTPDE